MSNQNNYLEERRIKLHNDLKKALGTNEVYFQPSESITMHYPCIVYERYRINAKHASNIVYARSCDFRVTVVSTVPYEETVDKLSVFPTAKYVRQYIKDNLYHDVFIIKY